MPPPPQHILTAFQKHAECERVIGRAWLFGSRATGAANPDSDWDVAVELQLEPQAANDLFPEIREQLVNQIAQDTDVALDLHLYHPAAAPDIVSAVREQGILIFFPWPALIHEAGHFVIGHVLGNHENGIIFSVNFLSPSDMAGASGMPESPAIAIRRSLAGMLACSVMCPQTFPYHLQSAFAKSVVLTKAHPDFHSFSPGDIQWWGGAYSDMVIAWQAAYKISGQNFEAAYSCLLVAEKEVRSLVEQYQDAICLVAKDVQLWLAAEDPEENAMMLYPRLRGVEIISEYWN